MAITLRQAAENANSRRDGRYCTVTFDEPTKRNSLLVVIAACASERVGVFMDDTNFVEVIEREEGGITLTLWYYEGAPAMQSVTVNVSRRTSFEVFALEYTGVRQTGALDRKQSFSRRNSRDCDSGTSAVTTQADHLVVAAIANRTYSCRQAGWRGGMTKMFERVTPDIDNDSDRIRCTIHQRIATSTSQWRLQATLSAFREWAAVLAAFKGQATGPARLTSTSTDADDVTIQLGGTATLTAFGPLKATATTDPTITIGGSGDMYPFDYQYSLNNKAVLIGPSTDYRVLSVEGLEGWQLRTSDDDQPLGDGAIRGVDLLSARQIVFELGMIPSGASTAEIEDAMRVLYNALRPQRDTDWEMIWRHPGRGVRMLRCRPIDMIRGLDAKRALFQDQKVALKAVDPRLYGPTLLTQTIPVSVGATPTLVTVTNDGNAAAYPLIRITPNATVTRVELFNDTTGVTFDVKTTAPPRAKLVGDMDARVRSTGQSVVTVNGASKYGAWQFPRQAFFLAPDPDADGGDNELWLRTTPDGADVSCILEYRHTYAG